MNGVLTFGLLFALTATLVPAGVHLGFRARRVRETGTPSDHGLAFEQVRIPTVRGRYLFGWLLPAPGADRTVVVLHGWGSNAELMLPIAATLRRAGLTVLLCDARNHSQSDSDTFSSLPRFAEDLGQAIAWCLATPSGPVRPRLEAARHRDIAALVSIGAFAHPAEVTQRTLRRLRLPRFVTLLVIRYVEWLIGYRFDNIAPINTVCRITFLVLLVRGRDDETVPVDDARRIADRCHAPQLRLLVVRGAGHGSTDQNQGNAGDLQRFLDANRAALA